MKKLFASASYSFNNFYNNLNMQGQMIFSIIIFLIVVLCILLFGAYVIEGIKTKLRMTKLRKESIKNIHDASEPLIAEKKEEAEKTSSIEDIASAISDALKEEAPISLTNFEEDQEKTAIISIDELMKKAKELELIDDDNGDVNYLEKYNLEPAEIEATAEVATDLNPNKEVKAFKVSQVISPIYGIKKEVISGNDKKA